MKREEVTLRWVVWPAVLTLAVTLLRLTGEVRGWDEEWFARGAGGQVSGSAPESSRGIGLLGITLLVPLAGLWFGARLARSGRGPERRAAAFLRPLAGMVVAGVGFAVVLGLQENDVVDGRPVPVPNPHFLYQILGALVAAWIGAWIARPGWPALWRLTAAYGWAARIPVILITFPLCLMALGTHYEKLAPYAPRDVPVLIRAGALALAQAGFWVPFTILVGMLCGALVALLVRPATSP